MFPCADGDSVFQGLSLMTDPCVMALSHLDKWASLLFPHLSCNNGFCPFSKGWGRPPGRRRAKGLWVSSGSLIKCCWRNAPSLTCASVCAVSRLQGDKGEAGAAGRDVSHTNSSSGTYLWSLSVSLFVFTFNPGSFLLLFLYRSCFLYLHFLNRLLSPFNSCPSTTTAIPTLGVSSSVPPCFDVDFAILFSLTPGSIASSWPTAYLRSSFNNRAETFRAVPLQREASDVRVLFSCANS